MRWCATAVAVAVAAAAEPGGEDTHFPTWCHDNDAALASLRAQHRVDHDIETCNDLYTRGGGAFSCEQPWVAGMCRRSCGECPGYSEKSPAGGAAAAGGQPAAARVVHSCAATKLSSNHPTEDEGAGACLNGLLPLSECRNYCGRLQASRRGEGLAGKGCVGFWYYENGTGRCCPKARSTPSPPALHTHVRTPTPTPTPTPTLPLPPPPADGLLRPRTTKTFRARFRTAASTGPGGRQRTVSAGGRRDPH